MYKATADFSFYNRRYRAGDEFSPENVGEEKIIKFIEAGRIIRIETDESETDESETETETEETEVVFETDPDSEFESVVDETSGPPYYGRT